MSKLALVAVALGLMVMVGGCMDSRIGKADPFQTPAYTGTERGEMIATSAETDWKEMKDDIDEVLMLRPSSNLTTWLVR
jgi:hypothetical protein